MVEQRTALTLLLIFCLVLSTLPLVNATEDSWTTLEPMPTARSAFGVAVVDGKIYAIGGFNGSYLATNEMYDPETDTWTTKTSMPTARYSFGIAVCQNKIYVIGGVFSESNLVYSGYTGVNEVYDPLTDTWETVEPMPTSRSGLEANVVNDKIYLIGGIKHAAMPPAFHQGTDGINEVYDPSTDSWTTKTPRPPTDTTGYASTVSGNKIYIMGGPNPGGDVSVYNPETGEWVSGPAANPNQMYDPETDTWTARTSAPTLVDTAAASATTGVLAPKRIYLLGGMGDQINVATNINQIYDPKADTWTNGTSMPTPRWSLAVAVVNDELYAIGGKGTAETFSSANEKYTPSGYIPEFPSWTIMPLILIAATFALSLQKRLSKRKLGNCL